MLQAVEQSGPFMRTTGPYQRNNNSIGVSSSIPRNHQSNYNSNIQSSHNHAPNLNGYHNNNNNNNNIGNQKHINPISRNNNNSEPRKLVPGGFRTSGDNVKHLNLKPQSELVKKHQDDLRLNNNSSLPLANNSVMNNNNLNNHSNANNPNTKNPKFHIQEAQEKDGWFITPETFHNNFLIPCIPTHLIRESKEDNKSQNNTQR